jgi:NADH:ubiquinone oxidoreductase subunit D
MKIIRISIQNTCWIKGDCFDRFMIRMAEMRESCSIIAQVCERITEGFITVPC